MTGVIDSVREVNEVQDDGENIYSIPKTAEVLGQSFCPARNDLVNAAVDLDHKAEVIAIADSGRVATLHLNNERDQIAKSKYD